MTIQTQIRINKWPFFFHTEQQQNQTCEPHICSHSGRTFAPVAVGPQMIDVIITELVSSLLKDKRAPSVRWLTNSLLKQTHCKQFTEWGVCGLGRCLWNYKEVLDVAALPLGYVSIMKPGEGHQSTTPGRLKFPDTTEPLKWSTVWANVFTHVCPDCHTHK